MPVPVKIDTDVNWTMMPTRDCRTCFRYESEHCKTIYNANDEAHSCGDGFDPSPAFATLLNESV
jgi:hypothetical protein